MFALKSIKPVAAAVGLAALGLAAVVSPASAAVVVTTTYSPYGLPAATGAINTIDLTGRVGQNNFTVNTGANQVTVAAANGGAVVQGSSTNSYAAPVTGGTASNPTYLTTPYFSSGGVPGTITLTFASAQSYLGLLWGSIGSGDYLSFRDATNTEIARVTGTDAMNSAAGFNNANGAQGFGGSQYTLVNLTGGQFTSVVIGQSASPSFEAASFQYAAQNVSVPEPASLAVLGLGLAGIGMIRRRKA